MVEVQASLGGARKRGSGRLGGEGFLCGRDQSALEGVDFSGDGCGVEAVVGCGERVGLGWWDDPGSDDAVVWCGGFAVDPFPSSCAGDHPVIGNRR